MRLSRILSNFLVALATFGILLPHVSTALASAPAESAQLRDVALGQGGVLRGQVMTAQGVAQAGTEVALIQNGQLIARALTDEQGRFTATGLRGGVYVVSTEGAEGVIRAWAYQTAPPSAAQGLLLVPQGEVVSGALGGNMGVGALLVGGMMITIVALASRDAS